MPRHPRSTGRTLPLVYSCSGCSSAAQLANALAIKLDRGGQAEMSCIAGVGGQVPKLVLTAQSGRPILAIDGCPLNCCKAALAQVGVTADQHLCLSDFKIRKVYRTDFSPLDLDRLAPVVIDAAETLAAAAEHGHTASNVANQPAAPGQEELSHASCTAPAAGPASCW